MKTRPDDIIRALGAGLESRREELGQMVIARVHGIDAPGPDLDPEYLEGLREAIEAAIDHSIEAAVEGDDERLPVPSQLLEQARLAARHRVPLETVLRRYLAGHALIGDFVAEEAARQAISPDVLRGVLRDQAARTDRVVAVISSAYVNEARAARPLTSGRRRAELVRRLLDGELTDPSRLDYGLDRWHVGVAASGAGAQEAIGAVATRLDAARLLVDSEDGQVWAWLGFRQRPEPERVAAALAGGLSAGDSRIGVGEPSRGVWGWRLTHDQARAALSVATRKTETCARYLDVALLASAMRDELLATSLRHLYVIPLEGAKDGGKALLKTLRTYLEYDQSVTSTAAALGVSRNTVRNRLRTIEEKVRPISSRRVADFKVALQLIDLIPMPDHSKTWADT